MDLMERTLISAPRHDPEFRLSPQLRIAVTVDMIAVTGIAKPLRPFLKTPLQIACLIKNQGSLLTTRPVSPSSALSGMLIGTAEW